MRGQVLSGLLGRLEENLIAMNIRLVGHRCTGKTSVGRLLAWKLGIPFWDTDDLIEMRQGIPITQIVERSGWSFFRAKEREVLLEVLDKGDAVVALGGGVVVDPRNRRDLKEKGVNIWLLADLETILQRMRQDPRSPSRRPPLKGLSPEEELLLLMEERDPLYREVAHLQVRTDGRPVGEIVGEILSRLGLISSLATEAY